jgi:hypothetical protein
MNMDRERYIFEEYIKMQVNKQVNDMLDKIRTEILQMPTISLNANDIYKADVLAILDKYKTESESEE